MLRRQQADATGTLDSKSLVFRLLGRKRSVQFYTTYRDQDENIAQTTGRLQSLAFLLLALDSNIQRRRFRRDEKSLIDQIEQSVSQCEEGIRELLDEHMKLVETSSGSIKSAVKVAGRRVAYLTRFARAP